MERGLLGTNDHINRFNISDHYSISILTAHAMQSNVMTICWLCIWGLCLVLDIELVVSPPLRAWYWTLSWLYHLHYVPGIGHWVGCITSITCLVLDIELVVSPPLRALYWTSSWLYHLHYVPCIGHRVGCITSITCLVLDIELVVSPPLRAWCLYLYWLSNVSANLSTCMRNCLL